MKTRFLSAATLVFVLTGLLAMGTAQADDSAVALLRTYVTNARNKVYGAGNYGLTVEVVTNQPNVVWASYIGEWNHSNTTLSFEDGHWVDLGNIYSYPSYVPTNYHGAGYQYFSNRYYQWPLGSSGGWNLTWYPFDPNNLDSVGIKINAENGSLEWELYSWGGGTLTTNLQAFNGILLGKLGGSSVMISVREDFQRPPH